MDPNRVCVKCMCESVQNGVCTRCGTPENIRQNPPHGLPLRTILHGRYFVGLGLGHGGFGITYAALDLTTGRRVAIKEYLPDVLSSRVPGETQVRYKTAQEDFLYGREQFLTEAQIIYTLRGSRNIIEVEKLFEEFGTAYYAMEFLEGQDLKRYLSDHGGKLDVTRAMELLFPVFDALMLIHSKGIIHRDVSPDNIFICSNGTVKLLDFGAAHAALSNKSSSFDVILKRGYAPIEQYMTKGHQGPWTDVYALAATIYHCITGKVPCEATTRVNRDTLLPASKNGAQCTRAQDAVLQKAMAVNAQQRYANMGQFQQAMAAAMGTPIRQATGEISQFRVPVSGTETVLSLQLAPIGRRVLASCIDYAVLGAGIGLLIALQLDALTAACVGAGGFVLLNAAMESGSAQASLGKRVCKLHVTDQNGSPLNMGSAVVRNVLKCLLSPLFIVEAAIAYTGNARQSLHCKLSSSVVADGAVLNPEKPFGQAAFSQAFSMGAHWYAEGIQGAYAGSTVEIGLEPVLFGRNPAQCNIIFPAGTKGVSGRHCTIKADAAAGKVIVTDVGSTYGTLLPDGTCLHAGEARALAPGERFILGQEVFQIICR